jgi:hypothetical protein
MCTLLEPPTSSAISDHAALVAGVFRVAIDTPQPTFVNLAMTRSFRTVFNVQYLCRHRVNGVTWFRHKVIPPLFFSR